MRKIMCLMLVCMLLSACGSIDAVPTDTSSGSVPEITVAFQETEKDTPDTETGENGNSQIEQLVCAAEEGTLEWVDSDRNQNIFSYRVPKITSFCKDAEQSNREIQELIYQQIEIARANMDSQKPGVMQSVGYETFLRDSVLSVLVCMETISEESRLYVWNWNVETGERLYNSDLIHFLGVSGEEWSSLMKQALSKAFVERNGSREEAADPENYALQRELSMDITNAELFLGQDGWLYAVTTIYDLSGKSFQTQIPVSDRIPDPLPDRPVWSMDLLPDGNVDYTVLDGTYEIDGYEAEILSWSCSDKAKDEQLYFRSPVLLDPYFAEHSTEGNAVWVDPYQGVIGVSIQELPQGPYLYFELDIQNGEIMKREILFEELGTVDLNDESLVRIGKMLAELMTEAREYHLKMLQ